MLDSPDSMVMKIGEAAGEIWRALDSSVTELDVSQLRTRTRLRSDRLHQGIGWLAREDKIELVIEGRITRIWLK